MPIVEYNGSEMLRAAQRPSQADKNRRALARRRSRLGRLRTARPRHVGCSSRHCVLVAAAAAPLPGGRHGGRLLQLRVSALGALTIFEERRDGAVGTSGDENSFRVFALYSSGGLQEAAARYRVLGSSLPVDTRIISAGGIVATGYARRRSDREFISDEMCNIRAVVAGAYLPSQADKGRRALARRRSRLQAAPTARPRHIGCSSLLPLRASRGSRCAALQMPAWRAAFAA